ncbi:hypothetical protein LOC51_32720 [Rubrivivax sp. JA1024]|nr:hypothetical protein [Rubrivivax sp. JA1024]
MKKYYSLSAALILTTVLGIGSASADSVRAVVSLDVNSGGTTPLKVEKEVGFTPKDKTITVEVSGYLCTMGSSTQGSVSQGCNYSIDITGAAPKVVAREASGGCMNVKPSCVAK